jgi:hypothetical protein
MLYVNFVELRYGEVHDGVELCSGPV